MHTMTVYCWQVHAHMHNTQCTSIGQCNKLSIKTQILSKHSRFIIFYYFRATCFDSLESSSGPLTNWPKTI